MTIVGEAELPVIPLAGTFTADLLKLATQGADAAGKAAAESFQKSFVTGLRSSSVAGAKFGTAAFAGLDIDAAKAGIAGGKAYSSGFTESLRTAGAIQIVTQDQKLITTAAASGAAGGKAYARGFNAGTAEGKATAGFEQQLRAAELGSAASGKRAGVAFLTNFKSGLLPLAAIIATVFAVKENTEFTATLTRIQTQAGASAQEVANVRKEILQLSPQVGIGPDALADGFYHLESAGFRAKDAIEIETAAAKEARIGNADLGTTVQALIGLEASHIKGITSATQAVSVLNTIVGNGDLKLQDLAKSLGTGAVAASSIFGLSIQDLGGALDTLTDNTVKPQEAMTRLRMTVSLIGAPSGPAIKALNEIGLSSTSLGDDLRKPKGLIVALTDLEDHLKNSGKTATEQAATLAHIFGGGRSSGAVDILITQMDRLQQKTDQLYASTANGGKVFDQAWATTEATTKQKLASLGAGFQVLAIEVGQDLEKPVNATLNLIHDGFAAAPQALRPLGDGLVLVAHETGDLLHTLEPVGHVLLEAFGGAVYVTVQAAGVLLRDVVAPAIHGVTDVVTFLGDHKGVLAAVATVIGTLLVPAIATMTTELALDAAAWTALALAGAVADVKNLVGAVLSFAAANPILVGVSLALGGIAAVIASVDHDARSFTIDINGLKTAVEDLQKTGSDKPLANTILDDISKWKPTNNGGVDAITYLQKYGLAASTLAQDLAKPDNLAGALKVINQVKGQLNEPLDIQNNFARSIKELKPYLDSANPAVRELGQLFTNLYEKSNVDKINTGTIEFLEKSFGKLITSTQQQEAATRAYLKAQGDLNNAGKVSETLLRQQATAGQSLTAVNSLLKQDDTDLSKLQKDYDDATKQIGDTLQQQFPIFQQYRDELNENAASLDQHVQSEIQAITDEQKNIVTLVQAGASPTAIAALAQQGPDYVAAAVKGTKTQIQALSGDIGTYFGDLGQSITQQGLVTGNDAITSYIAGVYQKQQDLKIQQGLVFTKSFDEVATQLHVIAGDAGRDLPDNVAQRVLAGRLHVINAMASSLTGPAKTTVQQLETLASNGGAGLASQLASAIANHTPLVVSKAEDLKINTNKQIQAIIKEWGIKVTVDDEATDKLQAIQKDVAALGLTGVASSNFTPSLAQQLQGGGILPLKAAGGPIDGPGPKGKDSVLLVGAPGEHMLTADDVDRMGGHAGVFAFRSALQHLAAGGPVLSTNVTINADNITNAIAAAVAGASGGGGGPVNTSGGSAAAKAYAQARLAQMGAAGQFDALLQLWTMESGWNPNAVNPSSGAYGIPQALGHGNVYALGDYRAQVDWGLSYIFGRYGSVITALAHENADHWYDNGGGLKPGTTITTNNTGKVEPILTAEQWAAIGKLVAAIAALTPASIEKLVTTGVTAAGAQISAAVKEGNGPLAVALENQLKAAEGKLYVTGLGAAGNPTQANKEAVTQASIQVATLTNQLKALNTVNAGLVTSLNNFVSAQQQYQQTLSGAITQGNGFTDVLQASGSPSDVASVLGSKLADVKSFASKITALKAAGFTPALIRDVAADGIQNGSLYADLLLGSTKAQVAQINSGYLALGAGQTNTANALTKLTEGTIPGISKASAAVYINQAIFTPNADVSALVGKAEYAQRTAVMDSGGMLAPGRTVVDNKSGRNERVLDPDATVAYDRAGGGVTIGKYEAHYNGVDLATAHAQSNRDLSLALAGARVGG